MRARLENTAKKLKEELKEYLGEDVTSFEREFFNYCYNNFYRLEKGTLPAQNMDNFTSEMFLEAILDLKEEIFTKPCEYVNSSSCENFFYNVSDIFKVRPNRWGIRTDAVVWEYFLLYFNLFDISLDLTDVDYIINTAKDIVAIFKDATCNYSNSNLLVEFWNEKLSLLIKARYNLWHTEMEALVFDIQ